MTNTAALLALLFAGCDGGSGKETTDTADLCAPTGEQPPVVIDCASLLEPLVFSDDPLRAVDYLVDCSERVVDLTIEPGAVVSFGEGASLSVYSGTLRIEAGTCPAVLQGAVAEPGHWRGIFIDNDAAAEGVTISGAEIHHAGGDAFNSNGDLGSIVLWAESVLTIEDTLIADSASNGLNATYGGASLSMARNTFDNNAGYAIISEAAYASSLDSETLFTGNGTDGLSMLGGTLDAEGASWAPASAPYRVLEDGVVKATGPFTIEAGVTVAFEARAGLSLGGSGALHAAGTAEAPVVLAGVDETRGAWRGVFLDAEEHVHRIEHTEIRHAGGDAFNSNGDLGALIVWADNAVSLDTVTISESAAYGLNLTYGGAEVTMSGPSLFTGNALAPVVTLPDYGAMISGAASYVGNDADYVLVDAGATIYGQDTWEALDVPYRLRSFDQIFFHVNIDEGAGLTLEPGVEVVAEQDTGFEVSEGSFVAEGTPDAPVVFRAADGASWSGFLFEDPRDVDVVQSIDHASISGAGSSPFNSNGDVGAVVVWADTQASVTNTVFSETAAPCAIIAPYNNDDVSVLGSSAASAQLLCDED